jgi:hypothetical protein
MSGIIIHYFKQSFILEYACRKAISFRLVTGSNSIDPTAMVTYGNTTAKNAKIHFMHRRSTIFSHKLHNALFKYILCMGFCGRQQYNWAGSAKQKQTRKLSAPRAIFQPIIEKVRKATQRRKKDWKRNKWLDGRKKRGSAAYVSHNCYCASSRNERTLKLLYVFISNGAQTSHKRRRQKRQ